MTTSVASLPASSSSNAAPRDDDDDVIFIPAVIPTVDLCTPPKGSNTSSVVVSTSAPAPVSTQLYCAICLQSSIPHKPHATKCGHVFCGDCIKLSMRMNRKCPVCNNYLLPSFVFPLYV